MATIFSAPTIGDPRAVGIKNGGISKFETDIVRPKSAYIPDASLYRIGNLDETQQPMNACDRGKSAPATKILLDLKYLNPGRPSTSVYGLHIA